MPTASQLIEDYIAQNNLSKSSQNSYRREASKYGAVDMDRITFKGIKNIVEGTSKNPNSKSATLNIALMINSHRKDLYDRITDYRQELRAEIDANRKKKLGEALEELPSYQYLVDELEKLEGIKYIVNYFLINLAFRNADFMLEYTKSVNDLPEKSEVNYIYLNPKTNQVKLIINNYKTKKSYGTKRIEIDDAKLSKELKNMNLQDGDALMPLQNGKMPSLSYIGDKIKDLSIDNLGETRISKIVIKHIIDTKDFKKLRDVSRSRGTSEATLLSNYNLYDTA